MAIKKSILSRLFRSNIEETENKTEDKFEDEGLSKEEQDAEASLSLPDPLCLELSPEHAINELWRLRCDQAGWLPVPVLRLEGSAEEREILPENQLERELGRLKQLVTSTADERLSFIKNEQEKVKAAREQEKELEEAKKQEESLPEENDSKIVLENKEEYLPDLDAQVQVFLTGDKMAAWLFIYPPMGKGRDINRNILNQALKEKHVEFGIEETLLESLCENTERYFRLFLAAQGKRPVDGKDGQIIDMFPRNREMEASVDGFGNVNYAELNFVHNVNEGDVICQILPPVAGIDGRTVTNQEISAKNGKEARVPQGRNTEVSEDGSRLIATQSGNVEFSGQNFQVKPVLNVGGNVDYSTGNINFLGDVHIKGNICSGFQVKATGNITVDGVLEASNVEAGGDLIVKKGVKGDNEAIIRAGRGLYAKYLESSVVCVKEHLESDCIINCDVYSDGVVQACSGRGIIIGGVTRAACEVRANTVGSKSEHLTIIKLGGLPGETFEYECLAREIEKLKEEYEKLLRQPDSPAKLKKVPMMRMKLAVDKNKLEQFGNYLKERKEDLQEQEGQRLVCSLAYPETEITISGVTLRLDNEARHCTAMLIRDEICLM
ncbi:MAG: DUF342 domain-containing protein [Lachnospiraceae bacterium]|nr:DUF342 domain-containing protein [Lachnospiraceae bacterium]